MIVDRKGCPRRVLSCTPPLVAMVLLVAACGSTTPTATSTSGATATQAPSATAPAEATPSVAPDASGALLVDPNAATTLACNLFSPGDAAAVLGQPVTRIIVPPGGNSCEFAVQNANGDTASEVQVKIVPGPQGAVFISDWKYPAVPGLGDKAMYEDLGSDTPIEVTALKGDTLVILDVGGWASGLASSLSTDRSAVGEALKKLMATALTKV